MSSMGVRAALAVLLLFIATVKADEGGGGVMFWRENVTMTCPGEGTWYKDGTAKTILAEVEQSKTHNLKYENSKKGLYYCEYGDDSTKTKYYFYVQGKVCANCYELDPSLFGLFIMVDVLGTAFVMMIIYRCTKKESTAGPTNTSKAPARSGGRAPPVPSPDYEELSAHTRSQDPYSVVNRMG